ncbi:hypothetical protein [endosymbiont GvMRE of Glomus versiforme]|uniref:hypothetical protein n=1 Tax=endosymbiont GvMRE of Glomus versiforme TaxID=2039283 RepID=UPI000ED61EBA|nr:hypothetical protein [endosymbiont GvMRE of Glomus versiforme]RHZ35761.1 hypothetical protein GvMRE_Ic5g67 [endosymbiont GvMRE of Glomus versiforme]
MKEKIECDIFVKIKDVDGKIINLEKKKCSLWSLFQERTNWWCQIWTKISRIWKGRQKI